MSEKWDKILVYFILSISFIAFVIIIFSTENSFGGADNFSHYKFAYWGWKYPELLFNHWGKPVFTILISPFAQFGFNGARTYNVIMGLGTAYLSWKLSKKFNFNQSWIVTILVLFTPVYFILMFTSLTEITFSFFLILSIFLFFDQKYISSATILSFIPLVRTEGIVLFPLFIIGYILKKKYKALPFLLVGFILFSLLGWHFHNNDLFWLINEMPYTGSASDIYGKGDFFHFFQKNNLILGSYLGLMFISSIIIKLAQWIVQDKFRLSSNFFFLVIIVGSFCIFYLAHSFVWWSGEGNSMGLIRVIGAVTPIAAITSMVLIDQILKYQSKIWQILAKILLVIFLILFIKTESSKHLLGFSLGPAEKIIYKSAEYLKATNLEKNKIVYFDPFLASLMNFDPEKNNIGQQFLPKNNQPAKDLPDGSIIVWDAHFGPNEGRIPLELLKSQPDLKLIKEFKPEKPFKVLGGYNFEVAIFQKINPESKAEN